METNMENVSTIMSVTDHDAILLTKFVGRRGSDYLPTTKIDAVVYTEVIFE